MRNSHPQGILKYYFIGKTSQVATILTIIMALIFLFIMITVNLGRIGEVKTLTSNAADAAALMLASQIGSQSKYLNIYVDRQAGSNKCDFHWRRFFFDILPIVMMAVGQLIMPPDAFGIVGMETAETTMTFEVAEGISVTLPWKVIVPKFGTIITKTGWLARNLFWGGAAGLAKNLVNRLLSPDFQQDLSEDLEGTPPEVNYREFAIASALMNTVTDPNMVQDNDPRAPDVDEDGDITDSVSAFEVWYEIRKNGLPDYYTTMEEVINDYFMGSGPYRVHHAFERFMRGQAAGGGWSIPFKVEGTYPHITYLSCIWGFLGFLTDQGFSQGLGFLGLEDLIQDIEIQNNIDFPWYTPGHNPDDPNDPVNDAYDETVHFLEQFINTVHPKESDPQSFNFRLHDLNRLDTLPQWFRELYNPWQGPWDTPNWLPLPPADWESELRYPERPWQDNYIPYWISGLNGLAGLPGAYALPGRSGMISIPQISYALASQRANYPYPSRIDYARQILKYFPEEVRNYTDEIEHPCYEYGLDQFDTCTLPDGNDWQGCGATLDEFDNDTCWYQDMWDAQNEQTQPWNGMPWDQHGDGIEWPGDYEGYDLNDFIHHLDHYWQTFGPVYYPWLDSAGWHIARVYVDRISLPYLTTTTGYWGWGVCYDVACSDGSVRIAVARYDEKKETPLWNFAYRRNLDPTQEQRETDLLVTLNSIGDANGDGRIDYFDFNTNNDDESTPWGAMIALVDEFGIESRAQADFDIDYPAGEDLENPYLLTRDRIRLTRIDDDVAMWGLGEVPDPCGIDGCQPGLGENYITCPADCPNPCNDNGICEEGENATLCPNDNCPPVTCGNGFCDAYLYGENHDNCSEDCLEHCGNHNCDREEGELPVNCPDCQVICPDTYCDIGEICPEDCLSGDPVCPNGRCEEGENERNCCFDCGWCGDGVCCPSELNPNKCPADCKDEWPD